LFLNYPHLCPKCATYTCTQRFRHDTTLIVALTIKLHSLKR